MILVMLGVIRFRFFSQVLFGEITNKLRLSKMCICVTREASIGSDVICLLVKTPTKQNPAEAWENGNNKNTDLLRYL